MAAERAFALKIRKIRELGVSFPHFLIPLAFKTLARIENKGLTFLLELGQNLSAVTEDIIYGHYFYIPTPICNNTTL